MKQVIKIEKVGSTSTEWNIILNGEVIGEIRKEYGSKKMFINGKYVGVHESQSDTKDYIKYLIEEDKLKSYFE